MAPKMGILLNGECLPNIKPFPLVPLKKISFGYSTFSTFTLHHITTIFGSYIGF